MLGKKLKKLEKELAPKIEKRRNDLEKPLSLKDWTNEELKTLIFWCEKGKDMGNKMPKLLLEKAQKTNYLIDLTEKEMDFIINISSEEIFKCLI